MQSQCRERLKDEGIAATLDLLEITIGEQDALLLPLCSVTFMELAEASKDIAIQLAHRFGVRCGDPILIDCGGARAAEVTAVFACIRCGAPFVPIADASLSVNAQNILHVIDTTRPMAAIVVGNSDEHVRVLSLNALGVFRIVLLDEMGCLVEAESAVCDVREDLPHVPLTGDLALYILFTSGSSGRPKGCVGTHKGLVSRLLWQVDTLPWDDNAEELVLRRTPLTFVDALAEMFSCLLFGVPLACLQEDDGLLTLVSRAAEQGVTRVTLLPSQLALLLKYCPHLPALWPALRCVVVSGENLPMRLVHAFRAACPLVTLVNLYGSTEVAGDVCFAVLNDELVQRHSSALSAPIGEAMPNNELRLVDLSGEILEAVDAQGELVIAGEHVSNGYYNAPAETSDRFRLLLNKVHFFTGDVVMRNDDGTLTWLGRRDNQVKVRGARMEAEDAEVRIGAVLGRRVVVVPVHSRDSTVLVAVVESDEVASDAMGLKALKTALTASLSDRYVPATVLEMPRFPLTLSGKVSRQDVNAFVRDVMESETRVVSCSPAPSSAVERAVDEVFRSLLPLAYEKDSQRNFFELGGNSMLAIEALFLLQQRVGARVSLKDLRLKTEDLVELLGSPRAREAPPAAAAMILAPETSPSPKRRKIDSGAYSRLCWRGRFGTGCQCPLQLAPSTEPLARGLSNPRWSYEMRKCVDASPVLCRCWRSESEFVDLVLVGSHGGDFTCIEMATGHALWRVLLRGHIEGSAAVLDQAMLVFVCSFAANDVDRDMPPMEAGASKGCVHCICISSGDVLWRREVTGETKSTPRIVGESLWVSAYDGMLSVLCVHSGNVLCSLQCGSVFHGDLCLSSDEQTMYGVTILGLLHVFDTTNRSVKWTRDIGTVVYSSICLNESAGCLVFGGIDSFLYNVSLEDGSLEWRAALAKPVYSTPQLLHSASGRSGYVVGSHAGVVSFFADADGSLIWSTALDAIVFSTPVVCRNALVVATTSGKLHLMSTVDGSVMTTQLPAEVYSSPALLGSSLCVGCRDNRVYLFDVSDYNLHK